MDISAKIVLGLTGAAAIAGGAIAANRMKKTANLLDQSIKDISNKTCDEITEDITKTAVDKAAAKAIARDTKELVEHAHSKMDRELRNVVASETEKARSIVTKRMEEEANSVDMPMLMNDIRMKVAEKVSDDLYQRLFKPKSDSPKIEKDSMAMLIEQIGNLDNDFDKQVMMKEVLKTMRSE